MRNFKRFSKMFPNPNQWLANLVKQRKISRRRLAELIGKTPTEVQRWISNREQIPRVHLAEIAMQLSPTDFDYVLRLKDCEDFADQLHRRIRQLTDHTEIGEQIEIAKLHHLKALVSQEAYQESDVCVHTLAKYLTDAVFAVRLVHQMIEVSYLEPLLSPTNVTRFQYPVNHFVGLLLDLGTMVSAENNESRWLVDLREGGLTNLRSIVKSNNGQDQALEAVRQFSVHVLARHGTPSDRGYIKERIGGKNALVDPLMRRVGFTGLILGGGDPNTIERFLFELQHDNHLATVNLLFDAFHYGDISFDARGVFPRDVKKFSQTIPQILRHIEQPEQYRNILDIECLKIVHLLNSIGPKPFMRPQVLVRLRDLVFEKAYLLPNEKNIVRKEFDRCISRILDDGRQQGISLSSWRKPNALTDTSKFED
jgi:transcriptional regulator with XRE-family HTH domain